MTDVEYVEALKPHRALGKMRAPGDVYALERGDAKRLLAAGYVKRAVARDPWEHRTGRELWCDADVPGHPWNRVVACLMVWNDSAALEQTMPTWLPAVDHVIAVDGCYQSLADRGQTVQSTDDSLALISALPSHLIISPTAPWRDQIAKRNEYLKWCAPGDLIVIVDADEFFEFDAGPDALRNLGTTLDVGWIEATSPLYKRPFQSPKLLRMRTGLEYRGRHHWLYVGDRLLMTHQYAGVGWNQRSLAGVRVRNQRGLGQTEAAHDLKRVRLHAQWESEKSAIAIPESTSSDTQTGAREALRILTVAKYDAGLAISRFHTAINTTTPHRSLYIRGREGSWPGSEAQFYLDDDPEELRRSMRGADVVHAHLAMAPLWAIRDDVLAKAPALVLHHHGTMLRKPNAMQAHEQDVHRFGGSDRVLELVSNLELLTYAPRAKFMPNPMPVARYRAIRERERVPGTPGVDRPFRIAHSPSKRANKGTDGFLAVIERLLARGANVEPVLIEGRLHHDALKLKASADVCFDSFWLGMQCAGLEAAAMGMPVIAGDETVKGRYLAQFGNCPYTFANTPDELESVLLDLMDGETYRDSESARVSEYALRVHDDAAVSLLYLDYLDQHFGWRTGKLNQKR